MLDTKENFPEQLSSLLNEIIEEDLPPKKLGDKLLRLSNMQDSPIMKNNQRLLDILMMKKNHEINHRVRNLTWAIFGLTFINVILVAASLFWK